MDRARLYRDRFAERDRASKGRIWEVIVRDSLQRWLPAGACVLDIGCGNGEFLNHIRAARRLGVDLNEESQQYLDQGIEFHRNDGRHLSFLDEGTIDVVFTSNTLEHLPTKGDVEQVLREAHRVLKPGGTLIALGPNIRFLPGQYWDFWDHFTPISDRSLVELLRNIGFEIQDCIPRFLPYTTRSRLPQSPWLVRLYLRMPSAWSLFGRQFLVRARKVEAVRSSRV